MLNELVVEHLGPIERAEITLENGSSALTGETGAGKTLLVASVGLLLGDRAETALVNEGAEQARVEGRFVIPAGHVALGLLAGHGLLSGEVSGGRDVEIVISRTITATGSKARVNGRMVPVSLLAEVGPALVEIAGQHEHQRFSTKAFQRRALDASFGDEAVALALEVADEVREGSRAQRKLDDLRAGERERARELDILRYEIEEIDGARIVPGEFDRLTAEAGRLEHAEAIASGLTAAASAIDSDGAAVELVNRARAAIETLTGRDAGLAELARRLEAAHYDLADIAHELSARVPEPDPDALENLRLRLDELNKLRRKYGDDEAQIADYLRRARARAAELDDVGASSDTAERDVERHRKAALEMAEHLSGLRRSAADHLAPRVEELLAGLAMPGARFEVALERCALFEGGLESVEFRVATVPGTTPRPVARVASGGELSRVALALNLLTTGDEAGTLIFDEVDAGVGGRAAQAVGRALAGLARRTGAQVLVVTHLPQVAAFAGSHYRVVREGRSVAVHKVEGDERVAELSRMLAGLPESERAREHAQELLDLAGSGV